MAVGYLAQMGDKNYFPMLLGIAKEVEVGQGREYVLAAAELGVDDAVPYLKELLGSANPNARANGVMGLGVTGSRAAVPILIETLKGSNAELVKLAANGLTELTHRSSEQTEKWATWWAAAGTAAKVYGPRECGEVEVLP
jgi:hypothetical protein